MAQSGRIAGWRQLSPPSPHPSPPALRPLAAQRFESPTDSLHATRKNLLLRQFITDYVPVLLPYAAIVAVIAATVGYLNQSANEDFIAKAGKRFFPGKLLQVGCKFCVPAKKQGFILFGIQPAMLRSLSIKYFNTFPLS